MRLLFPSEREVEESSHDPSTPKSLTAPLLPRNLSLEGDDLEFNAVEPVPQLATRPRSLRMLLNAPSNTIHCYWRKFDDEFMKPTFGGRGFSPCEPGTPPSDWVSDRFITVSPLTTRERRWESMLWARPLRVSFLVFGLFHVLFFITWGDSAWWSYFTKQKQKI